MAEVPGSEWHGEFDIGTWEDHTPFAADWGILPGTVRHTFTHFHLELTVLRVIVGGAIAGNGAHATGGRWASQSTLADEALPTLMRKVLAHAGVEVR